MLPLGRLTLFKQDEDEASVLTSLTIQKLSLGFSSKSAVIVLKTIYPFPADKKGLKFIANPVFPLEQQSTEVLGSWHSMNVPHRPENSTQQAREAVSLEGRSPLEGVARGGAWRVRTAPALRNIPSGGFCLFFTPWSLEESEQAGVLFYFICLLWGPKCSMVY